MRWEFMITVNIADNGDVIYECPQCELCWTIPIHKSESPFWDLYNGQAVLQSLAHFKAAHDKVE
jgi:hypothetical protein